MGVVCVITSSKVPRGGFYGAPTPGRRRMPLPPKAPMAWPVCARTDDANQNGARWRPLPAAQGGGAVNRPATSCQDPSNCFGSDWGICPHRLSVLCPGLRWQRSRLVCWPSWLCRDPCGIPQAPRASFPLTEAALSCAPAQPQVSITHLSDLRAASLPPHSSPTPRLPEVRSACSSSAQEQSEHVPSC